MSKNISKNISKLVAPNDAELEAAKATALQEQQDLWPEQDDLVPYESATTEADDGTFEKELAAHSLVRKQAIDLANLLAMIDSELTTIELNALDVINNSVQSGALAHGTLDALLTAIAKQQVPSAVAGYNTGLLASRTIVHSIIGSVRRQVTAILNPDDARVPAPAPRTVAGDSEADTSEV